MAGVGHRTLPLLLKKKFRFGLICVKVLQVNFRNIRFKRGSVFLGDLYIFIADVIQILYSCHYYAFHVPYIVHRLKLFVLLMHNRRVISNIAINITRISG